MAFRKEKHVVCCKINLCAEKPIGSIRLIESHFLGIKFGEIIIAVGEILELLDQPGCGTNFVSYPVTHLVWGRPDKLGEVRNRRNLAVVDYLRCINWRQVKILWCSKIHQIVDRMREAKKRGNLHYVSTVTMRNNIEIFPRSKVMTVDKIYQSWGSSIDRNIEGRKYVIRTPVVANLLAAKGVPNCHEFITARVHPIGKGVK